MKIEIQFFAGLTEMFANQIDIELPNTYSTHDVFNALIAINPSSENLLKHSRIATDEEFLEENMLYSYSQLFILPPASGG